MTAPELTLNGIRKNLPLVDSPRVSDFLTKEQKEARLKAKAERSAKKRSFSHTDAITAEILSRFGWDFYKDWNAGLVDEEWTYRMLAAERAREAADRLKVESVVVHMVKDCIRRHKGEKRPTGPKEAAKIIKLETKLAMGEE